MLFRLSRGLSLVCAALLLAGAVRGQTAIINKARAYLGSEAALDGVKSIHYMGKLVITDATDPTKKTQATIDIVYQKPDRHRVTVTSDKAVEATALDGYEGWQRIEDPKDSTKWRQTLSKPDQVKRLRANTWENISFFRGIETRGGRIEVLQPATIEGVACNKVAFIYSPNIIFYRYFDQDTGRLVQTETETGSTIREDGVINVGGIRFPKSLITVTKTAVGKNAAAKPTVTVTITFDEIKVNETFPDSMFAVPGLGRK